MDFELTDTERMLRDTFRSYFTREIEPHVAAMEHGELLPYELMRAMHRTLGLDSPNGREPQPKPSESAYVRGREVLGGLLNEYDWAA